MRFFNSLVLGASVLAAAVSAQSAKLPNFTWMTPASVSVGETYNVTYLTATAGASVTITLRKGEIVNLDTVEVLTSSSTGGSYMWTVSKSLPNGPDYALEITEDGEEPNYTARFAISGSTVTALSSSSASATASSSASSASSGSSSGSASTSASTSAASTKSSSSTSAASSSGTGSPTKSTTAPTGAAANFKSPMALVFGAVAAMAYLH